MSEVKFSWANTITFNSTITTRLTAATCYKRLMKVSSKESSLVLLPFLSSQYQEFAISLQCEFTAPFSNIKSQTLSLVDLRLALAERFWPSTSRWIALSGPLLPLDFVRSQHL